MTTQAKTLKHTLKELNICREDGSLSVRTERNYIGTHNGKAQYEFGDAVSHVRALDKDEVAKLKEKLPYAKIHNFPEHGFCIIGY